MAKINEVEYMTVKQLLAKGYEGGKVAEIVGRGRGVVSRINVSTSYDEFVKRGKAIRSRYKRPADQKGQQLPLVAKRPDNTVDLKQSVLVKWNALYDELALYKNTPTGKTIAEVRDLNMATVKLEEAEMWLKRHW